MGRVLRTTLLTGKGGVSHVFVVYGYQGAEEDPDTDKLLQAVLAEAQVVCIGQPLLITGDLNADPAVIPCLAKGISAGRFVDLALAYSLGAGRKPDATCKFRREDCVVSRRDFIVRCPNAPPASTTCLVTDRWFTPHFLYLLALILTDGRLMLPALRFVSRSGLLAGLTLPMGPPRRLLVLSRMPGMFTGMSLRLYHRMLFLLLGMLFPGLVLMISGPSGARVLRLVCLGRIVGLVAPLWLAALPLFGRGLLRIRSRRLGGRAVGRSGAGRL